MNSFAVHGYEQWHKIYAKKPSHSLEEGHFHERHVQDRFEILQDPTATGHPALRPEPRKASNNGLETDEFETRSLRLSS